MLTNVYTIGVTFEWDDANSDHVAAHGVYEDEFEEAATDPKRVSFPAHSGNVGFIGQTESGRYLVVILERKENSIWRPITAREAETPEKKSYRRRNKRKGG